MTPSSFACDSYALEFSVTATGGLCDWGLVNAGNGVRPVVNLNTENLTFTGTGTMQDPYVVS